MAFTHLLRDFATEKCDRAWLLRGFGTKKPACIRFCFQFLLGTIILIGKMGRKKPTYSGLFRIFWFIPECNIPVYYGPEYLPPPQLRQGRRERGSCHCSDCHLESPITQGDSKLLLSSFSLEVALMMKDGGPVYCAYPFKFTFDAKRPHWAVSHHT